MIGSIREIVSETERRFCIRLSSSEFFVRFALHVSSMKMRSLNHIRILNPMKTSLRSSTPFLYDIAIDMIARMRERGLISGEVSEDELSFIVLHIGAEIERQNITDNTISCVLAVPDYLNIGQTIAGRLMRRFSDQITIRQTVSLGQSDLIPDCDLMISVVDKSGAATGRCVSVSPFLTTADYAAVSSAIDKVQTEKSLDYLRKNFDLYFSSENFILERSAKTERDEAMDRLCDRMIGNGFVTETYRENVRQRENAVSTAYFDFAIPHSVCQEADVNTIGVMIAPNGIRWGGHLVHVVFMMAIAPDSLNDFQELYRILAQILTDTNVIQSLKESGSYEEFKGHILNPGLR